MPGFDLEGVLVLKSLEHGKTIKRFLRSKQVRKAVIIGMGYIALEMSEALRDLNIEVNMVKPRPVFLPWANPDLSAVVKEELRNQGVVLHLGQEIKRIEKINAHSLNVICEGIDLPCQMVLVAIGVRPNSHLAHNAALELGLKGAIAVWIPLALRANRAGWAVADNLTGENIEMEGVAGTSVFKIFYLLVARSGLSMDEAEKSGFDPIEVSINSRSRAHAHPGSSTIHVQMVGDRNSGRSKDDCQSIQSVRSGICTAIWTCMGPIANRCKSNPQEDLKTFACLESHGNFIRIRGEIAHGN